MQRTTTTTTSYIYNPDGTVSQKIVTKNYEDVVSNIYVPMKKLNERATIPTRGSEYAAGLDLYACLDTDEPVIIPPHGVAKIHTGIAMAIPNGMFGAVYPRSGIATKHGLRLSNCVGVIDSDYRGECIVPLYNDSDYEQHITHGQRIAQIVFEPYAEANITETYELSETTRGAGGFGSTGIN